MQERRELAMQLDPLCVHCKANGRITMWTELDHITSLKDGGEDILENCQGLCSDCHRNKTAQDMGYKQRQTIGLDGFPIDAGGHGKV